VQRTAAFARPESTQDRVYAGGAMTALFGPAFEPFKKRAREFGLAFASAHLVHIALVAWLDQIFEETAARRSFSLRPEIEKYTRRRVVTIMVRRMSPLPAPLSHADCIK